MNRDMWRVRATLAPEIKYTVSKINLFPVKAASHRNLFLCLRTVEDISKLLLSYGMYCNSFTGCHFEKAHKGGVCASYLVCFFVT